MIRSRTLFAISLAFAGAALACSGSGAPPTNETGANTAELTSSFADRMVQSTRLADGSVRATLADRDGVAATLTLSPNGHGLLEEVRKGSTGTFATAPTSDLGEINRRFDRAWVQARGAPADAVPYRMCGNWSSDSNDYCGSGGVSDCSNTCGSAGWEFYGSGSGCLCACDTC